MIDMIKLEPIRGGFIVPLDTHIGRWQYEQQRLDHDRYLIPLICERWLRPGMCVVDAGAFDGDHAIAYSEAVGKEGKVIAVEAGDTAFMCLQHNAGLFPIRNVDCLKNALGATRGIASHQTDANLGRSTCYPVTKAGEHGAVIQTTIDDIRENYGRKIDFIKLDIEGSEVDALKGAAHVLTHDRPILVIEVNRVQLARHQCIVEDLWQLLAKARYDRQIIQEDCRWENEQYDIACHPI